MPIFFRAPPRPQVSDIEPHVFDAINFDATKLGIDERRSHARRIASQILQPSAKPPIVWWRVLVAFALLVALFFASLWAARVPEYAKASETLLHCFELLFTATLGLFGIEAAKHG
jgi:hypothetical protein